MHGRFIWLGCIFAIVAGGILSRVFHTGFALVDKYLGDALYAMMAYGILRLASIRALRAAVGGMAAMTALELFQLTMIPAHMLASKHLTIRLCARLIGVQFSFWDLAAYGVGLMCICLADSRVFHRYAGAETCLYKRRKLRR